MSKYVSLGLLVSALVLGSCTRKAVPTQSNAVVKTTDMAGARNLDFRYLSAKGKAQIKFQGNDQNANINLRMRKDSLIWVSVTLFGIEGVRARITPDSVLVVNKLQKEYYAGNFNYLSQQLNVPVNFAQLQALLLGDFVPAPTDVTPTITTEGDVKRVQYQQAALLIEQLVSQTPGKMQKLTVNDQQSKNNLTVSYSDFQPLAPTKQTFAHLTKLEVKPPQGATSSATINYRNVEVDKERLTFPFSVPSGYARKK
ncbi:DUF4292 domain-containing protein [Hymenobacter sp. BT175]|uniref:DUF4292 domain-containing protein n=1 Tax=Hymenobacter translucens TaxID=2886507 RepID=UPI001D0F0E1D|nr:DUF4292 domain-containing protein [Hymenobacter translucens]MCC2547222.1 DUF4292 domain-containing protein [Hymenobacter translucens]